MVRQFNSVSCTYGAPMGRHASPHLETARRSVRLFRVKLDNGGYDDGGAYWGLRRAGESFYCAVDRNGDMQFTDATSRAHAALVLGIPWSALIVPGNCEEWAQRAIVAGQSDTDDVQAWVRESHMVENEGMTAKIRTRRYQIVQYRNGVWDTVISGAGKNRGTWDADHSRSAAYRIAAELRREPWRATAGLSYRVEPA